MRDCSLQETWRKSRRRCLTLLLGVVCLFVCVFWMTINRSAFSVHTNADTFGLLIPKESLNFGTVWEEEKFSWTVPIENHEAESVEIESFSSSCSCLSIKPKSLVIGPGERRRTGTADQFSLPEKAEFRGGRGVVPTPQGACKVQNE